VQVLAAQELAVFIEDSLHSARNAMHFLQHFSALLPEGFFPNKN
jgi:hypothetical protein